ncbi:DUF2508 family protein [Thermosediminibacter oceani]|uniref:DUF2508 domain-containing protein n=1 Tax=Thermosediminibacter oceani (strain ATCC BAA-1034 / DSM 16646 / JW/IW-1228P) TaxID=555079 RepID=D9S230_THEOJ|nr:DUF2508 family protein [Thermosediminibacter oceani]ADL07457.1 conserved hypothetical protein [Thermosediminibacter oceani DSM 16646]
MKKGFNGGSAELERILLEEIEKAKQEMQLAEKAFQWVQNDPEEVDAALSRMEAALARYNFLIRQAKAMRITIDKITMYSQLLQ